eukprot:m.101678 g.101678  ORF g.101678 m.101678 type:complete len:871 (+) comp27343_c0_seq1:171-2783(+)
MALRRKRTTVRSKPVAVNPDECEHSTIWNGLCAECHQEVKPQNQPEGMVSQVGWGYNNSDLLLSRKSAQELSKKYDENRLIDSKKLALIVDLDKTILHTTTSLVAEQWMRRGVEIFELDMGGGHARHFTKFRPGTTKFLEKMMELYEMHVYTMGTRLYAQQILKLIDPTKQFFSDRIVSQDESFSKQSKTANLDALFPNGYELVAVIDDSPQVWKYHPNLLTMVPYTYFRGMDEANVIPGQFVAKSEAIDSTLSHVATVISVPDEVKIGDNEAYGPALRDALEAELRYCLDTHQPFDFKRDEEQWQQLSQHFSTQLKEHDLEIPAPQVSAWLAKAKEHVDVDGHIDVNPTHLHKSGDHILRAIGFLDIVLAPSLCKIEKGTNQIDIVCVSPVATADTPSLTIKQTSLLLQHIECVSSFAVEDQRCLLKLAGATFRVIADADIPRAHDYLKARLRCQQYRSAVLLLRVFRQLLPSKYWGMPSDDELLLNRYVTEMSSGSRPIIPQRLEVLPVPQSDPDSILDIVGEILVETHKEFFRQHQNSGKADVATIFDLLRPRFLRYPCWALSGCTIVFSGLISRSEPLYRNELWLKCRGLGAKVVNEISPLHVTHLIVRDDGNQTVKHKEALGCPSIKIVTQRWLEECYTLGTHVAEDPFVVLSTKFIDIFGKKPHKEKEPDLTHTSTPNPFANDMDFSAESFTEMDDEVDAAMNEFGDADDDDDNDNDDDVDNSDNSDNDTNNTNGEGGTSDVYNSNPYTSNPTNTNTNTATATSKNNANNNNNTNATRLRSVSTSPHHQYDSTSDRSSPSSPGLDASEMAQLHSRMAATRTLKRLRSESDNSEPSNSDDDGSDDDDDDAFDMMLNQRFKDKDID